MQRPKLSWKSLSLISISLCLTGCALDTPTSEIKNTPPLHAALHHEKVSVVFSMPAVVQAQSTFRAQAVDTNALKYLRISLVGEGIVPLQGPLVPYTGTDLTLSLEGILQQPGNYRMVTVQGYDQNQQPLSAFVAKAWYRSQVNIETYQLEINRRQLVTVKIMEALLNQNPSLLERLNPTQIQNLVDQATGYNTNTGSFTQDPLSLQIDPLVNQFIQEQSLQASDLQNAALNLNGNVQIKLALADTQALIGEPLTIKILAPQTTTVPVPLGSSQNTTYGFNVVPGTYAIDVTNSEAQSVGSGSVTVQNDGSVSSQPVVAIEATQPIITAINRHSGLQDDIVTITGNHLNRITRANFNGTLQNNFETRSNNSLSFKVPAGVTNGPLNLEWGNQLQLQASDYFSNGRILYVKSGSNGSGISFQDAYGSLEAALAAAPANSEIWITEGTYTPAATLQLVGNTTLRGGFAASSPENNPAQRNWTSHVTTISGNNNKRIMQSADQVTLEGLTLSGGRAGANVDDSGGALNIQSGHNLQIQDCVFNQNSAIGFGGAIMVMGAANITRSSFDQNSADSLAYGGGAIEVYGSLSLSDSHFSHNTASWGGAISISSGSTTNIENTQFVENTANSGGGAIRNRSSSVLNLNQNTFDSNQSNSGGGALYANVGTTTHLMKNIFVGNQAALSGGALYAYGATVNVQQSILSGNSTTRTDGSAKGGAIYLITAGIWVPTVTLENSFLIGNYSNDFGSGIYVNSGNLNLKHVSFAKHFSAFQPNTTGVHNAGGNVSVQNTLFWRSKQNLGIGTSVDGSGNLEMDLPSVSPFVIDPSTNALADIIGPDQQAFTADDAYALNPATATGLIDKGYASAVSTDIRGQSRLTDATGINRGGNDSDADIGVYEYTP